MIPADEWATYYAIMRQPDREHRRVVFTAETLIALKDVAAGVLAVTRGAEPSLIDLQKRP